MTHRRVGWHLAGLILALAIGRAGPASADGGVPVNTIPPAIDAAGIHLTGGLPDGAVAPGTPVDVRVDPTAITGVPTPTVTITWNVSQTAAGSDVIAIRDTPHTGPLVAPPTTAGDLIGIGATVTAANPGGVATARTPELYVRAAPILSNSCLCFFKPGAPSTLRLTVGDRVPVAALELGTHFGIPRVVGGIPAPRVTTQWLRCRGSRCASIPSATKSSYHVTRRDIGYSLRLRVVARNPVGVYHLDLLTPGHLGVRARAKPKHRRSQHA